MESPCRVLLVEDDANFGAILCEHLQMQGYDVTLCVDGEEAMTCYLRASFDICLVDVMMPRKDGFTLAREVRERDETVPLIFLTAKSLTEDKIKGFGIGCDDYITKPFSIEELVLRMKAVLKRSGKPSEQATVFTIGDYTFDATRQVLTYKDNEQKLTSKESDLLRLLCLHKNKTLERNKALREIWGDDNYFSGRSMDVFVSRLRKYLGGDSRIEILGIHGKGVRLIVDE